MELIVILVDSEQNSTEFAVALFGAALAVACGHVLVQISKVAVLRGLLELLDLGVDGLFALVGECKAGLFGCNIYVIDVLDVLVCLLDIKLFNGLITHHDLGELLTRMLLDKIAIVAVVQSIGIEVIIHGNSDLLITDGGNGLLRIIPGSVQKNHQQDNCDDAEQKNGTEQDSGPFCLLFTVIGFHFRSSQLGAALLLQLFALLLGCRCAHCFINPLKKCFVTVPCNQLEYIITLSSSGCK